MSSTKKSWAPKVGLGLVRLLTVFETLAMGTAGWSKFGEPEGWTSLFVGWGYPAWFAFVIGAAEMGGAALLLVPRVTSYAAALLIVIMLGALATVLTHEGQMGPAPPAVNLVALSILLTARWGTRWRPEATSPPSSPVRDAAADAS